MTADNSVTPDRWLAQQIETDDPNKLRFVVGDHGSVPEDPDPRTRQPGE
ncbi:hypothetical protein Nocox_10150 [Nonomuraea coxensis DSM 45129]|uniref:Uncharacterized protein n=1 Tax=Nonomuraea coxensis DSM 45129 TaxID=1122611 RepID=A0ABX8TWJ1_9ACTN|nr:hypothetical protein [Nonomuraea coxensis]QYC39650.1 hypothetical protein Nocox_10150 [Nonomuraea coxensis DSM 45129]